MKDVERGLNLKLRVENYTSNRETRDFIIERARLISPDVRRKSGVWYRLNRWREEQIMSGAHDELLALDGIYASLWTHQSGGFLGDPAADEAVAR